MEAAEEVAKTFSTLLRETLGPEKMKVVVQRNRNEKSVGICHSHDFCDANMVMEAAVVKHGLDPHENEVWNKAWDIAFKREFK